MEATRETLQRCLVLALTPVLNQMSVMGVVSIPGMMTGQILGGTSPSQVRHAQDTSCKYHITCVQGDRAALATVLHAGHTRLPVQCC